MHKARLRPEEPTKARPISLLQFDKVVLIPGLGAASSLVVAEARGLWKNAVACDSIFLYQGEFIVNGEFFIPKSCGALLGWKY